VEDHVWLSNFLKGLADILNWNMVLLFSKSLSEMAVAKTAIKAQAACGRSCLAVYFCKGLADILIWNMLPLVLKSLHEMVVAKTAIKAQAASGRSCLTVNFL
jgi:hypothetical protein